MRKSTAVISKSELFR